MARLFGKLKPSIPPPVSLRDFHNKHETILVVREAGGLGDILMHRMIFEDFKRIFPSCRIVWAVPQNYFQVAQNHPFVDEVINCRKLNIQDYLISYNTTTACGKYELGKAPLSDKHRSDIWANHCGVLLTKHEMHLSIDKEIKAWAVETINKIKGNHKGPTVVFSPISAQEGKNLTNEQTTWIVQYLYNKGCFVVGLHTTPISEVTTIWNISHQQWMAIIDSADYVVSVDTATFHCAGGLKKPVVGIFTFFDGLVYSKYYPTAEVIQKHRLRDPSWTCGPCFNWPTCPKSKGMPKPCLTEIGPEMLTEGIEKMFQKYPPHT